MVGAPRDMTLIIAGFFTQNLPAKAVELMSNGFLLGWCQLQESFTSSPSPRGRLSSPFASIPIGRGSFGKAPCRKNHLQILVNATITANRLNAYELRKFIKSCRLHMSTSNVVLLGSLRLLAEFLSLLSSKRFRT